ncbi:hypothetical protein [Bacillus phage vB_BanS-Thrax2]|nr:hypothetical protein [Bacillus phage vB_BanS-Thrax2]
MEKKEIVVASGLGLSAEYKEAWQKDVEAIMKANNLASEIPQKDYDETQTLEEAIEEVAKAEGLTVEEVKQHLHKFQRDLYKQYTKKKVNKTKAKAKRKQSKKSRKKNR